MFPLRNQTLVDRTGQQGDGATELGVHPTGSGRSGFWRATGLVDWQLLLEA